jgi:hypothetical protein
MKTAVGVAYFPNDGIDKEKTDALFYELLENTRKTHKPIPPLVLLPFRHLPTH